MNDYRALLANLVTQLDDLANRVHLDAEEDDFDAGRLADDLDELAVRTRNALWVADLGQPRVGEVPTRIS